VAELLDKRQRQHALRDDDKVSATAQLQVSVLGSMERHNIVKDRIGGGFEGL
jgi:hypothetical protein